MTRKHTIMRVLLATIAVLLMLAAAGTGHTQPFAYIANNGNNNLSVIDTVTNTVVAVVPVGTQPDAVAVNPNGTRVYVANAGGSNSVSVIDTANFTVVANVPVGISPRGIAVNPAGTLVYAVNIGSNSVSEINTTTNTVVATVPVGVNPIAIAISGTRAYVTNSGSNNLSVIDTSTNVVTATVALGTSPRGVAVNSAGTLVYVANINSNNVSVIDATNNTVLTTVAVGIQPIGIAVNPTGSRVYVANGGGGANSITVIDTTGNTVVATVPVGLAPEGVAVHPAGTFVYAANFFSNTISVIDAGSNGVVATVAVGSIPRANGLCIGGPSATIPGAPAIGAATAGDGQATVSYTAPSFNGSSAITTYTATSSPDGLTGSATSGPINVTGLTNGTAYTFTVTATNAIGTSFLSASSNSVTPTATGPAITVSGTTTFPGTVVGASSAVQSVIITNSGATTLSINSITHSNASIFPDTTGGPAPNLAHWCGFGSTAGGAPNTGAPVNIAPNGTCVLNLIFAPNAAGALTGTININSNATPSTNTISLSGTGLSPPVPAVTLASANLNFGVQTVGTNSTPTTVTLNNSGTGSLTISSITISDDFSFTTTCPIIPPATAPLAPAGTCNIDITFHPLSIGALGGSVSIVSDAPGSPHTISLSGTGSANPAPGIGVDTTVLDFGNQIVDTSVVKSVAVTNTGTATLYFNRIYIASDGPPFALNVPFNPGISNPMRVGTGPGEPTKAAVLLDSAGPFECSYSLGPGATCYISVVFAPTEIGTATDELRITNNVSELEEVVTLTGNGISAAMPAINDPGSVDFGDQVISISATRVLTILSTGSAPLNVSGMTLSGADAGSFATSGTCTAIAAGASCAINITFTPTSLGAKSAQLIISSDAVNLPTATAILTGNGILAPRPIVNLSVTAIGYGNAIFGGATPGQVVTLRNTGGVALNIQNLFTVGDFVVTSACPGSLASGASCVINVLFGPLGIGRRTGELVLVTDAQGSPHRIVLSGTGCRWFSQAQSRFFLNTCGG